METMYQRGKIQDESMYYEGKKFDGSLPIIGVNTFLAESKEQDEEFTVELIRSTDDEKEAQISSLAELHSFHSERSPEALKNLQDVARSGGNVFEALLEAAKVVSLGQMTEALYDVRWKVPSKPLIEISDLLEPVAYWETIWHSADCHRRQPESSPEVLLRRLRPRRAQCP